MKIPYNLQLPNLRHEVDAAQKVYDKRDLVVAVNNSPARVMTYYVLNNRYWALPVEVWQSVIARNNLDKDIFPNESPRFNADDFAFGFKAKVSRYFYINGVGIAIGVLDGKVYVYNTLLVVEKDGSLGLRFFEPENGMKITREPDFPIYENREGLLII